MAESNSINANTTGIVGNTGTAFTGTAVTNHAVLVGGSTTSTITNLSVGATGTVLAGSSAADPSFTATPTVTSVTFGSGNALSTYVQGTFTPSIAFGGGTTGITYSSQVGHYNQIGNMVFFSAVVGLTNKGSSTGQLSITGLPVTSSSSAGDQSIPVNYLAVITLSATYTLVFFQPNNSATTAVAWQCNNVGGALASLTNAQLANTSSFGLQGFYFTT